MDRNGTHAENGTTWTYQDIPGTQKETTRDHTGRAQQGTQRAQQGTENSD